VKAIGMEHEGVETTWPGVIGARTRDYLVIAVLAFAVVLYEVAIIRVLSVVLWYHFAFLSISLAMLGLGVPGVWYALRPPGDRSLASPLVVAAVSIPVSVWAILQGSQWLPPTQGNWLFVALVVVCILVPMVSLGAECACCSCAREDPRSGRCTAAICSERWQGRSWSFH
jgi:hypothetical protein